jgi:hypothetical protein
MPQDLRGFTVWCNRLTVLIAPPREVQQVGQGGLLDLFLLGYCSGSVGVDLGLRGWHCR